MVECIGLCGMYGFQVWIPSMYRYDYEYALLSVYTRGRQLSELHGTAVAIVN